MINPQEPTARRCEWLIPTLLTLLSVIPLVAGVLRLAELARGARVTSENARFFAAPLPVVLHVVCASLFCLLGAFQFMPSFRQRRPGWHRRAGWLLVPCGIGVALSGLWMTAFYQLPPTDGRVLGAMRFLVAAWLVTSLTRGVIAARKGDLDAHRAFMLRSYAIAQGAGTQALTGLSWSLLFGAPHTEARAALMGVSWLINIVIAEKILRGSKRPRQADLGTGPRPLGSLLLVLSAVLTPRVARAADPVDGTKSYARWSLNMTPVLLPRSNGYRVGGGVDPELKYTDDRGVVRLSAGFRMGGYYAKNRYGLVAMPTLRITVPVGPVEPYASFGMGYGWILDGSHQDIVSMSRAGVVFRICRSLALGIEATFQKIDNSDFRFPSLGSMIAVEL